MKNIRNKITLTALNLYSSCFARKLFYPLNRKLFYYSIRGLGILNFTSKKVSGEDHFLRRINSVYRGKKINVVDVGANVGGYSKMILKQLPKASIYAFEPHPDTFSRLKTALGDNPKVHLINKGCANNNSKMDFYDLKDSNGSELATLHKEVIESLHAKKTDKRKVDIIKLDSFCSENKIGKIHLLKIDTEGSEFDTILGASELIRKNRIDVIHFEFNAMNVISRHFFKDFYDFLSDYDFYRLLPDGTIRIEKYDPLFCEIFGFQNIVAINKKLRVKL